MRCFNDFNYKPDKSWRCTSWKKLYISLRDLKVYAWKLDTRDRPNLISDIEESSTYEPFEIISFMKRGIVDITLTPQRIYALDRFGQLYSRRTPSVTSLYDKQSDDLVIQGGSRFVSITCGRDRVIGLAHDGTIWYCCDDMPKRRVKRILDKVIQIVIDDKYPYVLTQGGSIWFVPEPNFSHDQEPEPELIFDGNNSDTIVQLVALRNRMLALTRSGRVFFMDIHNHQSFAHSPDDFVTELIHYSGPTKRSIWGGFGEFAVCTDQGKLMFGNIYTRADTMPTCNPCLENQFMCKMFFGGKCYGALTKEGGLITWQKSDFCMFPESVQNSETLHYANWFKGKNVVSLAMYSRQCLVLAADKE